MADEMVTVARYTLLTEAQMALSRLEDAGISGFLSGDQTATVFYGLSNLGPQIGLQVPAADAKAAADVLNELARETTLNPGWEDEAAALDPEGGDEIAGGDDFWVCRRCGTAVETVWPACPGCEAPRDAVRTDLRDTTTGPLPPPERSASEAVRAPGGVAPELPPAHFDAELTDDLDIPAGATVLGDDLARHAFWAAVLSMVVCPPVLLPFYSLPMAFRLVLFPGRLSSAGWRHFVAVILLNGLVLVVGLLALAFYLV